MSSTHAQSLDFSGLDRVSFEEIVQDLHALEGDPSEERIEALDGLISSRTLWLLKDGDRSQLLDEALQLAQVLESAAGTALDTHDPATHGAWCGFRDLMTEAARRSDPLFVNSLLRSTGGRGEAILELLAASPAPVPRPEIRRNLDLSESHLSHLLRDLEKAELVVRVRAEGRRGVLVKLGRIGSQIVERTINPAWIVHLVDLLHELAAGTPATTDLEELRSDLRQRGAPSQLVADHLATALNRLFRSQEKKRPGPRWVATTTQDPDAEDKLARCTRDQHPAQMWSAPAERRSA
jgi:DNA-binding MarR family transcriptional regulator